MLLLWFSQLSTELLHFTCKRNFQFHCQKTEDLRKKSNIEWPTIVWIIYDHRRLVFFLEIEEKEMVHKRTRTAAVVAFFLYLIKYFFEDRGQWERPVDISNFFHSQHKFIFLVCWFLLARSIWWLKGNTTYRFDFTKIMQFSHAKDRDFLWKLMMIDRKLCGWDFLGKNWIYLLLYV